MIILLCIIDTLLNKSKNAIYRLVIVNIYTNPIVLFLIFCNLESGCNAAKSINTTLSEKSTYHYKPSISEFNLTLSFTTFYILQHTC